MTPDSANVAEPVNAPSVTVSRKPFGTLADGTLVDMYTLQNSELIMAVTAYGARVVSLLCRDRDGNMGDVVLGYNTLDEYVRDTKSYMGATAGRYANRIAGGTFMLEGQEFSVPANDNLNALHGGLNGFDRHLWEAKEIRDGVEFTLLSPDGENGFPGMLHVRVRYTLHNHTVRIEYAATTDKTSVVNLTNHAYFNLAGEGIGDISGEVVMLDADQYTPVNENLVPTGELASVSGSPFDFTKAESIDTRIHAAEEQLEHGKGYDHNFVIRGKTGELRPAARVFDPQSGRVLTVHTTEPGVQFYSGNHLDGSFAGKSGAKYAQRSGFCLETQHYPDSPNQASFPSTVLEPGQTFNSVTTWTFTAEK